MLRVAVDVTRLDSCFLSNSHVVDGRIQVEYAIDLQSGKKPYQEGDCADNPLFTYVKEEVFSRPTFAAFVELLVSLVERV